MKNELRLFCVAGVFWNINCIDGGLCRGRVWECKLHFGYKR